MKIAVVGAGIAGSTIALKLSEKFPSSSAFLFEAGPSLVNGPPICHLHAGGALYRQISDEDCLKLLEECVQVAREFKDTINYRPTVLSVPLHDPGTPEEIIRRMTVIKQRYKKLVQENPENEVLGCPDSYFSVFEQNEIKQLKKREYSQIPRTAEDWMVPVAKNIDFSKFKFPFVLVQEPGWSVMRYSAEMEMQLAQKENCKIFLNTKVIKIDKGNQKNWKIIYQAAGSQFLNEIEVDYLINSCGYKTGIVDDMVGLRKNRMIEFKAAYLAKWQQCEGVWPQFIIHGIRKTPQGMGQFTPYQGKIFQIHGMTQNITLFPEGLAETTGVSSHPRLKRIYDHILTKGWKQQLMEQRTKAAIDYISEYLPAVKTAVIGGKPLYGGQQIPGNNDKLRTASVAFDIPNYARAQIVKASSAIIAAQRICQELSHNRSSLQVQRQLINILDSKQRSRRIEQRGIEIAHSRKYPGKIAQMYTYPKF